MIFLTWIVVHSCLNPRYNDVVMNAMASQITRVYVVYSTVVSDADQRKYQSSASLVFVRGIHRGPVNSPHRMPIMRKMFPFDDVIMVCLRFVPTVLNHWRKQYPLYMTLRLLFGDQYFANRTLVKVVDDISHDIAYHICT